MIVAAEYLFFAALSAAILRFYSPTPAQVASAGAILIGAVSLVNLFIATRMTGSPPPPGDCLPSQVAPGGVSLPPLVLR